MQKRKLFHYVVVFLIVTTVIIMFQVHNNSPGFVQNVYRSMMNQTMFGPTNKINDTTKIRVSSLATLPSLERNETKTINTSAKVSKIRNSAPTKPSKTKPIKRARCQMNNKLPKLEKYDGSNPNVTVVTAYFNLGKFQKGGRATFDTPLYTKWAQTFKYMENPVVFFTDHEAFEQIFANVRSNHLNNTKIIRINRTELWSFGWLDRIRAIYSIKGYPKHHPNTVVPEYSCVQHSKHAVVEHAILNKHVTTKYVTWLDVGYFRYLVNRNKRFWIFKPRDFNDSRIAVNGVYDVNMKIKPESIFKQNIVWIGGGMAFATTKVYLDFVQDYKHAVERYLKMSLMNTDQQVLYAMNLPEEKKVLKPEVDLQIYIPDVEMDCWFYLGYSCYREVTS